MADPKSQDEHIKIKDILIYGDASCKACRQYTHHISEGPITGRPEFRQALKLDLADYLDMLDFNNAIILVSIWFYLLKNLLNSIDGNKRTDQDPRSKIQDPRSKIQDPRSKIQDPRSKIQDII
jgi:hypothetical protein